MAKVLNHVEMIYAPGDRDLAYEALELLGCRLQMLDDGIHMAGIIEPSSTDYINNALYVSEATPSQWDLEIALRKSFSENHDLAHMVHEYTKGQHQRPQDSAHFGIAFDDRSVWEGRVEAIRGVPHTHPHLAHRLVLTGLFPLAPTLHQAFVWTNLFAAGVITFGQHIELQWQSPAP